MTEAIERAKAEEAAGRAWRAKEILGGNVRQTSFDAQLYREYGELLLRLGDQMEAGKYLLLAGSTDPEHQAAINLFVGRHAGSPSALFSQLPVRARKTDPSEYPPRLRSLLEGLDIPESYRLGPSQAGGCSRTQVVALLVFLAFILVVGLLIFAAGLVTVFRFLLG